MPWTWTRTPRRILAPFAALALLLPHAVRANPAATEPAAATEAFVPTGTLTLQQLTTLAFARSTAVRADLAAAQIAKTDIRQAKLLGNPQLDATWGALPLGTSNPEGVARPWLTIPNYGIGISYQFLIGKRGPGVRRAEALAQAAGYSAQDTARHITMILARAIAALGVAQLRGAGLHEEVADQQDALELTKNRVSAGFGAPLEIDRLEIELERLQQQEAASVADIEAALTACVSILRMPCSPFVDVLTVRAFLRSWEDAAVLRAPGAEGAVALLEKRPDLRALEAGARASSDELALARARAIPDPTLRVGYIYDPFTAGGGQPHTASLTVSLPIPVFDSGQAAEQAARLRAEAIADQRRLLLAHAETRLVTLTATLRNRIARRNALTFNLPRNAALSEAKRLEPQLAAIIDSYPEVQGRISAIGRPADGTDPKLSSNLEVFVKLKPASEWPQRSDSLETLMGQMAASFAAIPGVDVNFSQPIRDQVAENVSGQHGQIALKIFSSNLADLQVTAELARQVVAAVPGATDVAVVRSGQSPQVHIAPNREALGRFGLTMGDVQSFLATAFAGKAVGTLWDGERNFDIALRLPGGARETIEQLKALRIPTSHGTLVSLSSVADIEPQPGLSAISREDGQRFVGVRMNVRGRDLGSFVDDARKAVAAKVPQKPNMQFVWAGEIESKERALARLKLVVPVALLVTLILLYASFRSIPLALLVLFNVPFVVIGGAAGLWMMDMPLSISACVGFIALVGQAALNGVLIVSAIEERRKAGDAVEAAILTGAGSRLRAVLMTSLLAALGLIPAVLSRSMGAEMQRPIAVVIVGGTISAALLTLFVLPAVYKLSARFMAFAEVVDDGPEGT